MVSNAKDDLPEPLNPVITTSLSRGIVSVRFFRLCSRAPPILMTSLLTARTLPIRQTINLSGFEEEAKKIAAALRAKSEKAQIHQHRGESCALCPLPTRHVVRNCRNGIYQLH